MPKAAPQKSPESYSLGVSDLRRDLFYTLIRRLRQMHRALNTRSTRNSWKYDNGDFASSAYTRRARVLVKPGKLVTAGAALSHMDLALLRQIAM
jgi:hypothetical protein